MKRSYLPRIDRLEDRCVPAADLVTGAVPAEVQSAPVDDTQFVIDVYLIDPNSPTVPTKPVDSAPPEGWTVPDQSIVPPIGDPFWN